MTRIVLIVLGGLWAFTGVYVFAQPQAFYDMVPGLARPEVEAQGAC